MLFFGSLSGGHGNGTHELIKKTEENGYFLDLCDT